MVEALYFLKGINHEFELLEREMEFVLWSVVCFG